MSSAERANSPTSIDPGVSSSRFLADNRSQPLHSACDLPFDTTTGRSIVVNAHQLIGRILLSNNAIRVIMRILVTPRITQRGRTGVVPVPQMGRHDAGLTGPDIRHCRGQGGRYRV